MGKKIIFLFAVICISIISCGIFKFKSSKKSNINYNHSVDSIEHYIDTLVEYEEIEEYPTMSAPGSIPEIPPRPGTEAEIMREESNINPIQTSKKSGKLVYSIPDTMIVLNHYEAIVRLSKNKNDISIEANIDGEIVKETIRVESKMEVRLVDVDGKFQISEVNRSKQIVEDEEFTEWKFDIMPTKTGQGKIKMVISIIIGDDAKEVVYDDIITIKSNPKEQVKSWWEKYWQWIAESLIIPFGIWVWTIIKKKKRKTRP